MAHRYLISQDSPVLYITVVTNNRLPAFQKDAMKDVLCRALDEARKHFLLFAYVIMVDHIHLLTSRPSTTSDVLRILKGLTARRVIDHLRENNYLHSLAKLRHQERDRNYKYSLWQTEKNVLPIFSERRVHGEAELHPSQPRTPRAGGTSDRLSLVQCSNMAGLSIAG